MMRRLLSCALLTTLVLSVLYAQRPDPAAIGVNGAYRCGPGDVLAISVFEVEELSGEATVSADGLIRMPLIGEVQAQGRTPVEIQRELTELYSRDLLRDPQISVHVAQYRSQPVSVLGAVAEPGVYQLQGKRKLIAVLAIAGGLSEDAGEEITITRPAAEGAEEGSKEIEIRVNVKRMLALTGNEEDNPYVEPHDVVRVVKAGIVYVMGAVERPGGFPIRDQERMTVLQAVSLASGLKEFAKPRETRIIREVDGVKREFHVPLKEIIRGRAADVVLQPKDVLYIPDNSGKRALSRGVETALQMVTGLVIWRR